MIMSIKRGSLMLSRVKQFLGSRLGAGNYAHAHGQGKGIEADFVVGERLRLLIPIEQTEKVLASRNNKPENPLSPSKKTGFPSGSNL
jgi:hypothetical protein